MDRTSEGFRSAVLENGSQSPAVTYTITVPDFSLPVTLSAFYAGLTDQKQSLLNWEVTFGYNSDFFQVLRKYRFVHADGPDGVNYNRLRIVDLDGPSALSHILSLRLEAGEEPIFYPNLVVGLLHLTRVRMEEIRRTVMFTISGVPIRDLAVFPKDGLDITKLSYPGRSIGADTLPVI